MTFEDRSPLIRIEPLAQYVPTSACLACDVCCRFPARDSPLRPYFTGEEMARASRLGLDAGLFPDPRGSRIRAVPNPTGPGYICPAFDPHTSRCRIYDARPLDCQLYPLALMWAADHSEVVLGWDTKCPFVSQRGAGAGAGHDTIESYAEEITRRLEDEKMIDIIADHPDLVGRYQDDVIVLRDVPRVSRRLRERLGLPTLMPLRVDDHTRFETAFSEIDTPLAAYALPPHLMWGSSFNYRWAELTGRLCLFASYRDGIFMPLPPLGKSLSPEAVAQAFKVMRRLNQGSGVTRIENIPEEWTADFEALGYRVTPKDPDYLYDAKAIAELRGDRYKSQRAAYNRFLRSCQPRYEALREEDREACRTLLARWIRQKEAQALDPVGQQMLRDTTAAHEELLARWPTLKLMARAVWLDGSLVAYTFGYRRSPQVFCVLAEVADRSFDGLPTFIFRRLCQEAHAAGASLINTLDDSGLTSLQQSKQQYRPLRLIPSYIATEATSG